MTPKTIHILSPSGAIAPDLIDRAAERLRLFGYRVSVAPHAYGAYGRFAGTPAERIADLADALANPAIDAILCARGGYGLQQILPALDNRELLLWPLALALASGSPQICRFVGKSGGLGCFDDDGVVSRCNPSTEREREPIIIGFSDITALHQWCGLHGIPSLHALMCKHLAELPLDSEPVQLWHQALQGEPLCYTLPAHPLNRAGQITGRLIGGNLSVLYGLQGTPYSLARLLDAEPDTPAILFIEDIAERHYHIDRMMQNLRMSGVLSRIAGLVVGQFSDCDDDPSMNCSVAETILRATDGYDYPVLFDFPAGHVERNLPLWLNAPCSLSVGNDCLLQSKKYR
ncbi:MAG: LD-carboxypeptidase [Paludibacteraceae bacterium]|nr:LD-carboxypeptidase [Paludibacteraceae bacterium]